MFVLSGVEITVSRCRKGCCHSHKTSSSYHSQLASATFTPPSTPPPHLGAKDTEYTTLSSTGSSGLQVECKVRALIPTATHGEFYLYLYHNSHDDKEHLAIVYGDFRSQSLEAFRPGESVSDRILRGASPLSFSEIAEGKVKTKPLVRIHSECLTSEAVKSTRCDCCEQLNRSMRMILQEGYGVIVYLKREERGIGLLEKLRAYNLQDLGHDAVTANLLLQHPTDGRSYQVASLILEDLGISEIRLLTKNSDKISQLEHTRVRIVERVPMVPQVWEQNSAGMLKDLDNFFKLSGESTESGTFA
ncbi:uncharacterized protein VTP21DRAFT_11049 [Calcarisporiella thermophila]|uniref:uncharacterized protein n=1 Tax=Calcarisporiella thermophila TaxID=911321 RepID=UPI0037428140